MKLFFGKRAYRFICGIRVKVIHSGARTLRDSITLSCISQYQAIHFLYIRFTVLPRWKAILKKTIYSAEYAAFREMLRAKREKLNLSQEELGKRLGKHQPFIARIESGQRRLDVVEFIHMMRIMGVSSVSFLKKLESNNQEALIQL